MFSAEVYFFAPLEVLVLVSFVLLQWNNVIKTKGLFRSQFWRLKGTETASVQFWQRNSVMAKASVCGRDYIHQALKSEEKDFANSQLFSPIKHMGIIHTLKYKGIKILSVLYGTPPVHLKI